MIPTNKLRHRHERNSWLICGGLIEWCYQCGAWRNLRHVTQSSLAPASKWHRPSGIGGPNPALKEKNA